MLVPRRVPSRKVFLFGIFVLKNVNNPGGDCYPGEG